MQTIVLSAGHGGRDPGAVGNGLREKDFNLAVVLATRDYLNKNYEGYKLVLPRDSDVFVSLPDRRDLTREVDADLYVSCHANSYKDPSVNGFETFVHSGPLYDVTFDYREAIHSHVYKYLSTLSIRDRGMKRFDHWVTRNMPCATVLVEYFFVSNPREAAFGKSDKHIERMGIATAKGIADAMGLPKASTPKPPDPPKDKPEALRPVGVMIGDRMTDHEAWLLEGDGIGTFGRIHPILKDLGIKVTGHGDHIQIHLPVNFKTMRDMSKGD